MQECLRGKIRINIIGKINQQKIQPNGEITLTPCSDPQTNFMDERLIQIEEDLLSAVDFQGKQTQTLLQCLRGSSKINKKQKEFLEKIDQLKLSPLVLEYQKQWLEKYKLQERTISKISQYFQNHELLKQTLQNQLLQTKFLRTKLLINTRHQFFEMINCLKISLKQYTQLVVLYFTATNAKDLCEISKEMIDQNSFCLSHISLLNKQSQKRQFSLPENDSNILKDMIKQIEQSNEPAQNLNFGDGPRQIENNLNFILVQISGGSFSLIDIIPLRLSEIHDSKDSEDRSKLQKFVGIQEISMEQESLNEDK